MSTGASASTHQFRSGSAALLLLAIAPPRVQLRASMGCQSGLNLLETHNDLVQCTMTSPGSRATGPCVTSTDCRTQSKNRTNPSSKFIRIYQAAANGFRTSERAASASACEYSRKCVGPYIWNVLLPYLIFHIPIINCWTLRCMCLWGLFSLHFLRYVFID